MPEEETSSGSAEVTTRTGDDGYTSLLGPGRVPKYDSRPTAFGTLDEATSALGLARSLCEFEPAKHLIYELQQGLYKAMAELATPQSVTEKVPFKMTGTDVERQNEIARELKRYVTIGKEFIIPGDTAAGSALDLARTIVRRGERLVVRLAHDGEIDNPHLLQWLNRLSDSIFILARYVESSEREGAASSE